MPSPANFIPVYGANNELLYYAPISRVEGMIESGRVRRVGTKKRTRAVVAEDRESAIGLMLDRPTRVPKDIFDYETDDNPRGVWCFKFHKLRLYEEVYREMTLSAA